MPAIAVIALTVPTLLGLTGTVEAQTKFKLGMAVGAIPAANG